MTTVTEEVRAQRFKRRAGVATNHLHDFQAYVLREVRARYDAVGLKRPVDQTGGAGRDGDAS